MKENKKLGFKNFETLKETSTGILVGGFTVVTGGGQSGASGGGTVTNSGCVVGNNCQGGNCVTGCGGG